MSAPPPPTGAPTFVDGRFLDPESGEVVEGDLRVENGRIVSMGVVDRADSATVELSGRTVVPGLIDAHFHAYASGMGGLGTERRLLSFVAINAVGPLEGPSGAVSPRCVAATPASREPDVDVTHEALVQ